jgi:hypothetical protein
MGRIVRIGGIAGGKVDVVIRVVLETVKHEIVEEGDSPIRG